MEFIKKEYRTKITKIHIIRCIIAILLLARSHQFYAGGEFLRKTRKSENERRRSGDCDKEWSLYARHGLIIDVTAPRRTIERSLDADGQRRPRILREASTRGREKSAQTPVDSSTNSAVGTLRARVQRCNRSPTHPARRVQYRSKKTLPCPPFYVHDTFADRS